MTDASRKAKERASRKAKGEVRVEVWLSPERADDLAFIQSEEGGVSVSKAVSVAIWFAALRVRKNK